MLPNKTPYDNLDPHMILDSIDDLGLRTNGSLLALNSFENRVYQIGIEDERPIIAKFYRPHRWTNEAILEEHEYAFELKNLEIPVVAPLIVNGQSLHVFNEFRFALFPSMGGRTFEYGNLDHLEWVGRFLGRIHAVGAKKPFKHRIELNEKTYGHDPFDFLCAHNFLPDYIKDQFVVLMQSLIPLIKQHINSVKPNKLRLHGDFHPGNILWGDDGPRIVDLDDCLMGPAIQDIWMLLSGDEELETQIQINKILSGYEDFCDFDDRELKLIECYRTLRMINYIGWLAKRWDDPAFPRSFPWFNTQHYWQEQYDHLQDQYNFLNY